MPHAPSSGRVLAALVVLAIGAAAPASLAAQGGDRSARRVVADSTCLAGRACRLGLADLNAVRRRGSHELHLVRGLGRDEIVLGPAWARIAPAVGAYDETRALAHEALRIRARAGRRTAIAFAVPLVLSVGTAFVVARRSADTDALLGIGSIAKGVLVALPVGVVSTLVLTPWANSAHRESELALQDAVTAWNRRVDPRVP